MKQSSEAMLKQLEEALLEAFDETALRQLLRNQLGIDVERVDSAPDSQIDHRAVIAHVIHYFASQEGGLRALVQHARQAAPTIVALQQIDTDWHGIKFDDLPELNSDERIKITKVDTGGGAYVGGSVNTHGGDFVGRDKHIYGAGSLVLAFFALVLVIVFAIFALIQGGRMPIIFPPTEQTPTVTSPPVATDTPPAAVIATSTHPLETATLIPPTNTQEATSPSTPLPTLSKTPTLNGNTALPAQLAFFSERDGNREIYLIDADGNNEVRLTNSRGINEAWPAWSPNGLQIAFESDRSGNYDIYTMDVDQSNLLQITNRPEKDQMPSWSPDGKRIAFFSEWDEKRAIFAADVDGSNLVQLTDDDLYSWSPRWSPDGKQLVFISTRNGLAHIFLMAADGSNQRDITNTNWNYEFPAWAPDGQQLVYVGHGDDNAEIYVQDLASGWQRRLTSQGAADLAPTWSLDGQHIAFYSYLDGHDWEIYSMDSNGKNVTKITDTVGDDRGPVWRPIVSLSGIDGITDCTLIQEISPTECNALFALYASTDGPQWTNRDGWLQSGRPCDWYGVTCVGNNVTGLNLNGNNLTGELPAELSDLTQLTILHLSQNQLSGTIPASINALNQLTSLALNKNHLTGSIPVLNTLKNLRGLALNDNDLSGPIPDVFSELEALTTLQLHNNELVGSIPSSLGQLTQIELLDLAGNKLEGTIPPTFGNLKSLRQLRLYSNQFSGPLPAELGELDQLTTTFFYDNQFVGPIPLTFKDLPLEAFNISNTQICVPSELKAWLATIEDVTSSDIDCPPTLRPAPTLTPTATSNHTPEPVNTAMPTPPPISVPEQTDTAEERTVSAPDTATLTAVLFAPENDASVNGRTQFSWHISEPLPDGYVLELIFWEPGQDPMVHGFGPIGTTTDSSVTVNLDEFHRQMPGLLAANRWYDWGLLLVSLDPYTRWQFLNDQHRIYFGLSQSGGEVPPIRPPD